MKYRVLLLGMNKGIIDEFFERLQDSFDAQTTTFRKGDMDCHIKYLKPDAIIFCMHNETPENIRFVVDYKGMMQERGIPLVIVGSQTECDDFEKLTHRMSALVLTKPISGKGIKEKVYELLESMNVPLHADDEPVQPMSAKPEDNRSVDQMVEQVMAASVSMSMEEQVKRMVENASGAAPEIRQEVPKGNTADISGGTVNVNVGRTSGEVQQEVKQTVPQETSVEMPNIGQTSYMEEMQSKIAAMVQKELNAAEQQPQEPIEPVKKHVLVVDDDPMMLKLIKEQLKDNYAVGTAISGSLAMRFLENKTTDLIILDYEMPVENGPMVLKRLRRNPELAKIPVLFLTGVSEREKIKQVVELKPEGYILKPIEKDKLIGVIKQIIG